MQDGWARDRAPARGEPAIGRASGAADAPGAGAGAALGPHGASAEMEVDPAIGRLNYAGFRTLRHCTMFAVAPRVAVTAAHCIAGLAPGGVHLLFGYARMAYVALDVPATMRALAGDVAVLCLSHDTPRALRIGDDPGAAVAIVGYGVPAAHRQTLARCPVVAADRDALLVGCTVTEGTSGAPVMSAAGAVVAVVSRSGPAGTIAQRLLAGIAERCP